MIYYNMDYLHLGGIDMKRSPLIGISIAVACVIVLASFTNVVGVQTVESSDRNEATYEVDKKELHSESIGFIRKIYTQTVL